MKQLNETTNISILDQFDMGTGYPAVVQKGNKGGTYVYGVQARHGVTTVLRGPEGSVNTTILRLSGDASGHTQTWEFAGNRIKNDGTKRAGQWFIGVKPSNITYSSIKWAKQIARIDIRKTRRDHSSNTDFPRLAFLSYAGSNPYGGKYMTHEEAAISPDYTKLLIASVESNHIGHFTIYDLDYINQKLDEAGTNYVSLKGLSYIDSFTINNLYDSDAKPNDNTDYILNSIQGFDIDNSGNIYISSQQAPKMTNKKTGSYANGTYHKQVVIIPYDARSDEAEAQWTSLNLSAWGGLDISGHHTEVEGIQVLDENTFYLTVAYHAKKKLARNHYKSYTYFNKMFKLQWQN